MKIVILSALGNQVASRCVQSLLETASEADFDLHLIRESGFREQTLNRALALLGTREDILFVGDDITFTPGWLESLQSHRDRADILGMTMLYPDTNLIQDRGYDLLGSQTGVALVARDRGLDPARTEPFGFRFCDGVCGCFLYVHKEVFSRVPAFSEQGMNRWGEFIFICEARRAGFTAGVIEQGLFHGGVSTKSNPDPRLSSTSYLVENQWWLDIVRDRVDPSWVKDQDQPVPDEALIRLLSDPETQVLVYGAGTAAEIILQHLEPELADRLVFCSGLAEEVGLEFHGHTLVSAEAVDPNQFAIILMTPLRRGEDLFHRYFRDRLSDDSPARVLALQMERHGAQTFFKYQDLSKLAG